MWTEAFVMNVLVFHAQADQLLRGELHETNRTAQIKLHRRIADCAFQFVQIHQTYAIKRTFRAIGFGWLTIPGVCTKAWQRFAKFIYFISEGMYIAIFCRVEPVNLRRMLRFCQRVQHRQHWVCPTPAEIRDTGVSVATSIKKSPAGAAR